MTQLGCFNSRGHACQWFMQASDQPGKRAAHTQPVFVARLAGAVNHGWVFSPSCGGGGGSQPLLELAWDIRRALPKFKANTNSWQLLREENAQSAGFQGPGRQESSNRRFLCHSIGVGQDLAVDWHQGLSAQAKTKSRLDVELGQLRRWKEEERS